jgi:xanthine dehydrogenase YagT iron-sulfur-binding subunit
MDKRRFRVSRRDVLRGAGAAAILGAASARVDAKERTAPPGIALAGPGPSRVALTVNGKPMAADVEPRVTLLDMLRDHLGLTGSKRICDRGACGGCTVWLNGKTVNSCTMLAHDAAGAKITTIEGLADGDKLHPMQAAFVKHDALMCGFCTPGMIMSCADLTGRVKNPTDDQIRQAISGNLCRCGTYTNVFAAVKEAGR